MPDAKIPEMDFALAVIRDSEPGPVPVERHGHDQAHAVQGPEHGPRLRIPGGDPARGARVVPPPAASWRPSPLKARDQTGSGPDSKVRIGRPEGRCQRVTIGRPSGPPADADASD